MIRYKDAGVDIDRGKEAVQRIKKVLQDFELRGFENIGAFGGILPIADLVRAGYTKLVASIDGVGTKTLVAGLAGEWEVCGYDVIAHGVNDILVQGARPLCALDYIGTGRLNPDRIEAIVRGMARACQENEVLLIGGETAEMPDIYQPSDADIVSVMIGLTHDGIQLPRGTIEPGDILLGLESNGLHTNGYTLVRKILFEYNDYSLEDVLEGTDEPIGQFLLRHHRSYYPILWPLIEQGVIKALAHITGGGLPENVVRVLPSHVDAHIRKDAWPIPVFFQAIRELGNVPEDDMFRTFNMGIGMVLILSRDMKDQVMNYFASQNERVYEIGTLVKGHGEVMLLS